MRPQQLPIVFLTILIFFACQPTQMCDVLIIGGTIYDGSGGKSFKGNIAIRNDSIVAIGKKLGHFEADTIIDASGLAVSPGFIDLHTHLNTLFRFPSCESHVRQGVTTALGGPDGGGPLPFGVYLDSIEQHLAIGMNLAYLVGHNTIRRKVMGLERRVPTEEELNEMKALVEQSMNEGAFGISTGLKYLPGAFSKVDEVIALSKVSAQNGGIYTSHLREEGLGLLEGVQEAIQIGAEADIPIVLTHHKVVGKPMWGASKKTLAMVDSANALGLDIMIDQYPYNASYTSISILIPAWCRAGGNKAFTERCEDPKLYDSILNGTIFNIRNDRGGDDLNRVQFARVSWKPELEGKTLKDWAEIEGMENTIENGARLVLQAQLNGGASCIFHAMNEEDVRAIMQHPKTMIASDGRLTQPGEGHPHPRWYGTFPRVLGHYARDEGVLDMATAIHKMTHMPADRIGLANRGRLQPNAIADIVIFNEKTVIDKSTFENPHQYPVGIEYVLVNGKITVAEGQMTETRAGKVLRKNKWGEER